MAHSQYISKHGSMSALWDWYQSLTRQTKFHLIVDLSHPAGASVNDWISPTLCSLHYASVDEAVSIIKQLGRGTQLVKLDIKDACRIIPVHPADYHF